MIERSQRPGNLNAIRAIDQERLKSLREHIELRFKFAGKMSAITGEPLWLSIRRYTDVYGMLRIGGPEDAISEETKKKRQEFEWSVEHAKNESDAIEMTADVWKRTLDEQQPLPEDERSPWMPFGYTYDEASGQIRTHFFGGRDAHAQEYGVSALSGERFGESSAKLKLMFQDIKDKHPHAEYVEGISWLYNLEAYRRLFPPQYVMSADNWYPYEPEEIGSFALWGQFYDRQGGLNKERAALFEANMEHMDPQHPENAFPLQPIVAGCSITHFYRFYGIE